MKTYLDSSALVKLYYPEKGSQELAHWVQAAEEPIPYNSLHELELTNAISLKVFRREISKSQQSAILKTLKNDLKEGILEMVLPSWGQIFSQAASLSKRHSVKLGCRSLDILHVSMALGASCESFITFDERQAKLAKAVGLRTRAL